jgi:hypothetical protein
VFVERFISDAFVNGIWLLSKTSRVTFNCLMSPLSLHYLLAKQSMQVLHLLFLLKA